MDGSHWVGIFMPTPYIAYYFDSLGDMPNKCIIDRLLKHFTNIKYNKMQLQPLTSSTCGLYVIYFIYFMACGVSFDHFISMFDNKSMYVNYMFDSLINF
jgi:hypothetical protein